MPREQTLNVPNTITVSRFFLALVVFGMMSAGGMWIASAILFVVAVATDVLDGYIARKYNIVTTFGRIVDPFVDKFITTGVFLFLLPVSEKSGVSAWMVIAVLAREMLVTSLRGFLEQKGHDFSASGWGKLKMFLQCAAATAALLLMDDSLRAVPGLLLTRDLLLWVMTIVTVYTGWIYIARAAVILRHEQAG
ncbi:MAG: CDP-diacylglycerol--glycerol-3-phosphate 3-phosphatidyltransferase [Planctomyces sp.]|nr:CDP-diacylglycerol--glycerol-3-phosphate 3-phosphatidyltransferase [Planctomyces sp.]